MKKYFLCLLLLCFGIGMQAASVTLNVHDYSDSWGNDDPKSLTLTAENVSSVRFTFSQAGGTSVPAYYSDGLRIYNNNTIRIESLGEQDITTIAFTYTVKNDGTLQVVSSGVYDDATHTWTGSSSDVLLQEVSSTGTSGPQVRITQIVVTLSDAGSEGSDEGGEQNTDAVCLTTADERCVFLETPQGWGSSANVYIWNDSSTISLVGEWPGLPATPIYGGLFYKFAIPDNATGDDSQWKIIWNDGNVQTEDLPFTMRGLYTGTRYSDIACTSTVTTLCADAPEGIPDAYFLVDVPRTVLLDTLLASAVIAVNDSVSRGATSHFTLEYHRRANTSIAARINPIRMYHNDTLLLNMTGNEIIDSVMVRKASYGSITPVPVPRGEWYNDTRSTRWYGYRIYDYATGPQAIRWVNDSITPEGANGPNESVGDVVVAYHYPRPAQVEQSTTQFAFSNLNVFTAGVQEEQTVYLYNYTDAPVTITSLDGLAAPFSLKTLPVLPMTLPAQKGIHLEVVFAPTQVDTYADTLTITTDQGNYTVAMSGEAVYYGKEVFPWPATRNNGIVSGATAHGFTYQQIQNTGSNTPNYTNYLIIFSGQRVTFHAPSEYIITGITMAADEADAGPYAVSTQPAALSAEYGFQTFVDNNKDNGWKYTFAGVQEIVFDALPSNSNNDGELHWRKIEVQYEHAQALVQSATSLAFPNVMVNSSSRQSVKLTNYTKGAVSINSLSSLAAPFSVLDAPALPVTLQPNQSLTLKVQYAPVAVGSHAGTLLVATSEGEMSVALSGNAVSQTTYPMILAPAHLFYDFDGTGLKGFVDEMPTNKSCFIHTDISSNFAATAQSFETYSQNSVVRYIEDVNRDSVPDFGVGGSGFDASLSTEAGRWERQPYLFFITNFDLNSDGRFDYLHYINGAWKIGTQQTDGTFVETGMNVMYQDQYETTFDAADWAYRYPDHTPPATMPNFSGACLAKKPGRLNKSAAESIGSKVGAPTRMIDLNMDGYTDLVDEKNGIIYYNMFDGKWVKNEMGGAVQTVYLNDDDIPDFIVYGGGKINTVIYRGNGQFDNNEVWNGFACDDRIFCYDFDKDGQVEILTTFSTLGNQTGAAYTMFFDNDGQGNFTMQPEQTWTDSLYFTCCQDIDGDGYMDLLGIKGCISLGDDESLSSYYYNETKVEVVWLKGQPNLRFSAPMPLLTYPKVISARSAVVNAEDLDNDGIMEIWVSGLSNSNNATDVFKPYDATPNMAPTAPAAPTLVYNPQTAQLSVNWGNGADNETATCDLTYALRIGTTAGGSDILRAHANSDGTRRNFLDGNMGRAHSYTIDLSSYAPATIYVAVQAIDAQHKGSAWSEEAQVEHTYLNAAFSLSANPCRYLDTLRAYYTPFPEDYTLSWEHEGAALAYDRNGQRALTFTTTGEQTISLTVTAPDGTATRTTQRVQVMPNAFDTTRHASNAGDCLIETDAPYIADYNADGHYDWAMSDKVYIGDGTYGGTTATGMWAANLDLATRAWYDYDHDGWLDILYKKSTGEYGYIRSNGAGSFNAAAVTDANVSNLLTDYQNAAGIGTRLPIADEWVDINHDGYPDGMHYEYSSSTGYSYYFLSIQPDGSGVKKTAVVDNGDNKEVRYFTNCYGCSDDPCYYYDFNHDGWLDKYSFARYNWQDYTGMYMLINKGNFQFEETLVPFAQSFIPYDGVVYVVDMNSDGYADILSFRENDYAPFILWNDHNQSFSAPEVLAHAGDLQNYSEFTGYGINVWIYDFDNNGYLDLMTVQYNTALLRNEYYVHYFDAEGVMAQGFISEMAYMSYTVQHLQDLNYDGLPDVWSNKDNSVLTGLLGAGVANEQPQAPTGVTAVQTADGLLIQWNDAADDHTPAAMMRYNLSVKKKGATGKGAYIISPMNGGNAQAAPMLTGNRWINTADNNQYAYPYIESNQYIIPLSAVPVGELEIQVQALDMWAACSPFSETVRVKIEAANSIDAPITVCAGNSATVTYTGPQSAATPVWDFAGGTTISGTGFGPYEVLWQTPGTKQVSLTMNGETSYRNIVVSDPLDATFGLPAYVTLNAPIEFTLPRVSSKATFEWQVQVNGGSFIDINDWNPWPFLGKNYVDISATPGNKQGKATFLREGITGIRLIVNDNGCSAEHTVYPTLLSADAVPVITYVAPNANNKYVIHWDAASLDAAATGVVIYKEGSYYGEFYEVGTAAKSAGEFADPSSNATVKAERYCIALTYGSAEGMKSEVHQPLHVMINRGMADGQWNLMWNPYQGTQVATYRILRGTSADNMQVIANLSASNNSYTDLVGNTSDAYYAVEYDLYSATYQKPSAMAQYKSAAASTYTGRSNVVSATNANQAVLATRMNIYSVNKSTSLSSSVRNLMLYAEIFPGNATYQQVQWAITQGNTLATIDQNGLVTALEGHNGGTVVVTATTKDGSNLSATLSLFVSAIQGETPDPDPDPVTLTGVSLSQTSLTLTEGTTATLRATVTPAELASQTTLTWVSSAPAVASVSAQGVVSALAAGKTTITVTATCNGVSKTAACQLTVKAKDDPNPDPDPETAITVRLQAAPTTRDASSGVSQWVNHYLYAWQDSLPDLIGAWPGIPLQQDADGWYSYTFANDIQTVNIIWHDNAGRQTVDITGVTESTCYQLGQQTGAKFEVIVVDCNLQEGLENTAATAPSVQKIVRNGQVLIIRGDKTYDMMGQEVE